MLLGDCLGRVHQDIITCWNFRDEEKARISLWCSEPYSNHIFRKTLSSNEFKQLMQYLVQDVQESQNQDGPHVTP